MAVQTQQAGAWTPFSRRRPGGMGAGRFREVGRNTYGVTLGLEEVERRIEAYHRLCPELTPFLRDEVDAPLRLAGRLRLTPSEYRRATGRWCDDAAPENAAPAGWLGGMLLKALREATPATQGGLGRPYTPEEGAFFRDRAGGLEAELDQRLAVQRGFR